MKKRLDYILTAAFELGTSDIHINRWCASSYEITWRFKALWKRSTNSLLIQKRWRERLFHPNMWEF